MVTPGTLYVCFEVYMAIPVGCIKTSKNEHMVSNNCCGDSFAYSDCTLFFHFKALFLDRVVGKTY